MTRSLRQIFVIWLGICSSMVFLMVLLGGAVRLTGSGLSMVDWHPLMGAIPPIGLQEWVAVFERYKQFPEFKLVNQTMNLEEFKFIFLMEYFHRLLGRLIGLVFFIPFIVLLVSRKIPPKLVGHLWGLLFLGALQGVLGWYMVKSGLVNDPHVSQYRLTAHFMLAVIIYIYMLRLLFGLFVDARESFDRGKQLACSTLVVVLVMMITGGFVAGTKAGFIFNTYPKMGGNWVPDMLFSMSPFWHNFLENPITIQFVHRWLAVLVLLKVLATGIILYKNEPRQGLRNAALLLCLVVIGQVLIGVVTLIFQVPVELGVAHQAGAMILITVLTWIVSQYLPAFTINSSR